jgi:hypothetical protein
MATMGEQEYLIEAKWWAKPIGTPEIQSLEDRLKQTSTSVVGVLVSYSGFTAPAIDRVERKAKRPILLVTGEEIERAIDWDGDFMRMLRQKREALRVHSKVVFVSARSQRPRHRKKRSLPSALETFVLGNGTPLHVLASGGGYGQFAFVRELPDIDWVPGSGLGVTLDVGTTATDESELLAVLYELSNLGWLTRKSRWSIQQSTTNWHGAGAKTFADALVDWRSRYRDLEDVHHTEEFCYVDACDDIGFYSLTGQVAAHTPRIAWRSSLSFQLSGIPVNLEPLRHLCGVLDPSSNLYFRPRKEESVSRHCLTPDESRILDVVGYVGEEDEFQADPNDREWAVGVVAENPYWSKFTKKRAETPNWWPDIASDSELIVCSLRSWHPMGQVKKVYRLWSCESAWTSDALAFSPVADWDRDDDDGDVVIESRHARDQAPLSLLVTDRSIGMRLVDTFRKA